MSRFCSAMKCFNGIVIKQFADVPLFFLIFAILNIEVCLIVSKSHPNEVRLIDRAIVFVLLLTQRFVA